MTDRARPGLVALYDIRPGNWAGQFLQPRSPHGASWRSWVLVSARRRPRRQHQVKTETKIRRNLPPGKTLCQEESTH